MTPSPKLVQRNKHQPAFDAADPPPRVTRPMAAAVLFSKFGIVVSPRSLESWSLPVRILAGKATFSTNDVLMRGRAMVSNAPAVCGGRARAAARAAF